MNAVRIKPNENLIFTYWLLSFHIRNLYDDDIETSKRSGFLAAKHLS